MDEARRAAASSGPVPAPGERTNAEELRFAVSRVLTIGIAIAAVLLVAGFGSALAVGWSGSLVGRPASASVSLTDFGSLPDGLAALRPAAIGQLGLLALVLTPVSRVAASILLFAHEHDRLYVVVTSIVLLVLLASLLLIR